MTCATLRVGVAHPRADLPALLQLIEQRRFDPRVVNTLVADWVDAPRALLERTTKVVLRRAPLFPMVAPDPGGEARRLRQGTDGANIG